jgi:hypothetical protein
MPMQITTQAMLDAKAAKAEAMAEIAKMRAEAKLEMSKMRGTVTDSDAAIFRKANSREQYNAEKAAGGPMTDLDYEQWKNLD